MASKKAGEAPQPPNEAALQQVLGDAYGAYRALLDSVPVLRPEWKYYGQKYGWGLKLFAGKRNLCFLAAREHELGVAFIFGERDVPRVLAAAIPQELKDQLAAARQYAEGKGLRIQVHAVADLAPVHELLEIKRNPLKPHRG